MAARAVEYVCRVFRGDTRRIGIDRDEDAALVDPPFVIARVDPAYAVIGHDLFQGPPPRHQARRR